ncbi:protein LAX PANICLE 2-like isoform X2 [Zingiber officinale]|uniref:protein LAX PANICLE 2-like isoform X2 n=1 Tax=Zingiber officinale TaxID=94328 RepID=UPI001C4CEE66|nr:protein LAX PANICLE 2-like isoform X2 [Zingiber officinale]
MLNILPRTILIARQNLTSMDEEDPSSTILLHEEQEEQEEEEEEEDTPTSDWLKLALPTSSDRRPNLLTEPPPVIQPCMLRSETPEFFMRAATSAPPDVRMRVVSPPRRSQPDVWLILQAAQNQSGREPYLPQIAKNYLRIKDGRSTLRLLMKYLVKKLGLEDESEKRIKGGGWLPIPINSEVTMHHLNLFSVSLHYEQAILVEITCRDQQLHPFSTLQYVRNTIWCSGNSMIMTPNSPAIDHVMTLQYRRSKHASVSGPLSCSIPLMFL